MGILWVRFFYPSSLADKSRNGILGHPCEGFLILLAVESLKFLVCINKTLITRWWFQIFFILTPTWEVFQSD